MGSSEGAPKLKLIFGGRSQAGDEAGAAQCLPAPEVKNGIPKGSIVELLGSLRTQWLIQFFKFHPELKVFWADREHPSLPSTLHQRGVDLSRITFGTLGLNASVPLRQVIQSNNYAVIIAPNKISELRSFKALQEFTEKTQSILFLLGDESISSTWPMSMQLAINGGRGTQFGVEILRKTH